ncbi:MAG: hypothetical protein ACR2GY_11285 [Phycisphaerales bacterium]
MVSMRISRITSIDQSAGSHKVFLENSGGDSLIAKAPLPKTEYELEDSTLAVSAHFDFKGYQVDAGSAVNPDSSPFIEVAALFVITYELDDGPPIDADDLSAFALVNGSFNLWPYWREYLEGALVRAGLPRFRLPPLNLAKLVAESSTGAPDQAGD